MATPKRLAQTHPILDQTRSRFEMKSLYDIFVIGKDFFSYFYWGVVRICGFAQLAATIYIATFFPP